MNLETIYPNTHETNSKLGLKELKILAATGAVEIFIATGDHKNTENLLRICFSRIQENGEIGHQSFSMKTQRGKIKWYKSIAAIKRDLEELRVNYNSMGKIDFWFRTGNDGWPDNEHEEC